MEFYYYYKSCDVRLIRSIIYDFNCHLESKMKLEDWRYFDLITEVNDDVEDVFEDQYTINGNRFLISILETDLSSTKDDFLTFIKEMKSKEDKYLTANTKLRNKLLDWTSKELKRTEKMIISNSQKIDMNLITSKIPFLEQ